MISINKLSLEISSLQSSKAAMFHINYVIYLLVQTCEFSQGLSYSSLAASRSAVTMIMSPRCASAWRSPSAIVRPSSRSVWVPSTLKSPNGRMHRRKAWFSTGWTVNVNTDSDSYRLETSTLFTFTEDHNLMMKNSKLKFCRCWQFNDDEKFECIENLTFESKRPWLKYNFQFSTIICTIID